MLIDAAITAALNLQEQKTVFNPKGKLQSQIYFITWEQNINWQIFSPQI